MEFYCVGEKRPCGFYSWLSPHTNGSSELAWASTGQGICSTVYTYCNENPIYVFLFWELRDLSPDFHIHVSVSDLYIPGIGPYISRSRIGRTIVVIYKSLTDTWMWKLGLWSRNSFSGNICFEFSILVPWSAGQSHLFSLLDIWSVVVQVTVKNIPDHPYESLFMYIK